MTMLVQEIAALSPTQRKLLELKLRKKGIELGQFQITPRTEKRAAWPLSFGQRRLWFLHQLDPTNTAYHVAAPLRLEGKLDPGVLRRALAAIVDRHEVLRTRFTTLDEEPVQVVEERAPDLLSQVDLRRLTRVSRERATRRIAALALHRPFDLERGPLMRAILVQLEPALQALLLVQHHAVTDGWSMGIFFRELWTLYGFFERGAFERGEPSPLAPLAIQYVDYALWQQRRLDAGLVEQQLGYWRRQLEGFPPLLELPVDRPWPSVRGDRGGSVGILFPPMLTEGARRLAKRAQTTPFVVLLAVWQLLLHRSTHEPKIAVGSPLAGRGRQEIEPLIGFFVNTLVLATDFGTLPSSAATMLDLLARVREVNEGANAHQDLPFERLVDELRPERSLNHSPLFQAAFAYQAQPGRDVALGGLRVLPQPMGEIAAMFELHLSLTDRGELIAGGLTYSAELFDRATAARLVESYRSLLAAAVSAPERPLAGLPVWRASETHQLLHEWNPAVADASPPGPPWLHERFLDQARRDPERTALVIDRGIADRAEGQREVLSYGELSTRAAHLARRLGALGVGRDQLVGLCLERSSEMVVGIYGILLAGAAWVPLDPAYPEERLGFMLADSAVRVLLTQRALAEKLAGEGRTLIVLDEEPWPEAAEPPAIALRHDSLAYMIYTSGSTGRPKGAMNSHGAILNRILWMQDEYRLDASDRVLQKTPFSFDVSVWEFLWPLSMGARLVVARPGGHQDSRYLVELIGREGITTLHFVPSMLRAFLEEDDLAPCAGLRRVIASGEALATDLVAQHTARLGAGLHNLYGPTEAAIDVSSYACTAAIGARPAASAPIGRPIAHTELYLCDAGLRPVGIGVAGELMIGGVGLARGYHGRPGLTAERFVPDPLAEHPGARLYKTGDRARTLADGAIEYLDRLDFQVKIRGFRIELGEIQAALARHPAVAEAAVLAWPPNARGGAPRQLVAWVVPAGEALPEIQQLRGFLAERLPEYMVPARFVTLATLPLSPNGKLDRKALPAPESSDPAGAFVASRTETEAKLAEIWQALLRRERVGVHDNFFEIGGDSILGLRVVSRAAKVGLQISGRQIFQHQTIAELAAAVEQAASAAPPIETRPAKTRPALHPRFPLAPVTAEILDPLLAGMPEVEDVYPLAPAQEGMLFFRLYDPDSKAYFQQRARRFEGGFRVDLFVEAWRQLVARHPVLRTCFLWQGLEQPLQVVMRELEIPCEYLDWRELAAEEQEQKLAAYLAADREQGFVLERAPLMRLTFFRLADDVVVFNWTYHHILLDGWSLTLVRNELYSRYVGLATGRGIQLSTSPPFREFIAWITERDEAEAETFWRGELAGFREPISLGLEPATTAPRRYREEFDVRQQLLEREPAQALQRFAVSIGVTLNTVVQAAWAIVLGRYGGGEDVLFGATTSGRSATIEGIESMVGVLINTLPVRVRLEPETTLAVWMRKLQQRQIEARSYEHTRLVQIQRWTEVPPPRLPFETLVVFENTPKELDFDTEMGPTVPTPAAPTPTAPAVPSPTAPAGAASRPRALRTAPGQQFARTSYPVTLLVMPLAEGISFTLGYDLRLYEPAVMTRVLTSLAGLLAVFAQGSERRLRELPLQSETERRQLLDDWNRAAGPSAGTTPSHELVARRAAMQPEAVALAREETALSYGELARQVAHLARELRGRGVHPEVRVALFVERSFEMILGMLAIFEAGGVYVPLDIGAPGERLAFILADAEVALVLTSERLRARLPEGCATLCFEHCRAHAGVGGELRPAALDATERLAYLVYTSGSTGRPKAVMVGHPALAEYTATVAQTATIGPGDRMLQFSSPAFDASFEEILPCLIGGGTLVLRTDEMLELRRFFETCTSWRITLLGIATAYWHELAAVLDDGEVAAPKSLRLVIIGGERARPEALLSWLSNAPQARQVNTYGPTEATIVALVSIPARPEPRKIASGTRWEEVPIGRPRPGALAYVVDRWGEPCAVGIAGELLLGGGCVARGYLGRPALSAASFVPDPWSGEPGARLYRSGDLVRFRPDLQLEFLGRIDRQVKIRGFRVELGEVEAALAAHPGVRDAAVASPREGSSQLVAYVELAGEPMPSTEQLRAFVRERLPEFMVPASIAVLARLPRTVSDKIDRNALPALEIDARQTNDYVAPRDRVEHELAAIFQQLFGHQTVSVRANFFDLGGNSILALRLLVQLRKVFGRELPLAQLFERNTIEELAEVLRQGGVVLDGSPLVPIQKLGQRTPLVCVHPAGGTVYCYHPLGRHLAPDQPLLALQSVGLDGKREPLQHVEAMVAVYVEALLSWQPVGPYVLAGWSVGGVIAFAMAVELERRGEEVAHLILFDTLAPEIFPHWNQGQLMLQFASSLGVAITAGSPMTAREFLQLGHEEQMLHVLERARRRGAVSVDQGLAELRRLYKVFECNIRAIERYEPATFGGSMLFLRPTIDRNAEPDPTVRGWRRHVAGELTVDWVPGTHGSMVADPHVAELARKLRLHLKSPRSERHDPQ